MVSIQVFSAAWSLMCSFNVSLLIYWFMVTQETAIDEDDPGKGYLQIRVGFHSGPVVANVIGTRNKKLCIFGDTGDQVSGLFESMTN